mmetsp:Transcript_4423/g.10187  ORF Transcript_4423/g.10187 Transcript_4423/m.10187 type:complete len:167 (+) Transcript_4423:67-567(+)
MRIEHCYFCSSPIYPGKGTVFVRNDCKVFRFCRSKCHKNFKLKRNPRHTRWTKAFRKAKGKELAVDSVFEFERRRNIPIKTDRVMLQKALRAIKRTGEIKAARERRFHENRMKGAKTKQTAEARAEIRQTLDIVVPGAEAKLKENKDTVKLVAQKLKQKRAQNAGR